ncbi:hypothetical protein JG687_00009360 [Phytophthora cactorum]|uniref:Uncharacterized protein n=1 Tax=Phytophthora cactorum TaxID=29920 RepID=A0A8T1UBF3_9STRA|nr:hypothetical protein JG687_00009360 [Phytophthora cactorum]
MTMAQTLLPAATAERIWVVWWVDQRVLVKLPKRQVWQGGDSSTQTCLFLAASSAGKRSGNSVTPNASAVSRLTRIPSSTTRVHILFPFGGCWIPTWNGVARTVATLWPWAAERAVLGSLVALCSGLPLAMIVVCSRSGPSGWRAAG